MFSTLVLIAICLKILGVENVIISINNPPPDIDISNTMSEAIEKNNMGVMGLNDLKQTTISYDYGLPFENKQIKEKAKKPCSMMLVSNGHSPAMQSLLRKYRYDANGVLIPSSVKYYIKLPQSYGAEPILIPLSGKAVSPLGGYVRYYKELPPIPPSL